MGNALPQLSLEGRPTWRMTSVNGPASPPNPETRIVYVVPRAPANVRFDRSGKHVAPASSLHATVFPGVAGHAECTESVVSKSVFPSHVRTSYVQVAGAVKR